MDVNKKSAEMADNILKALGQEQNPASILISVYIKTELEQLLNK